MDKTAIEVYNRIMAEKDAQIRDLEKLLDIYQRISGGKLVDGFGRTIGYIKLDMLTIVRYCNENPF